MATALLVGLLFVVALASLVVMLNRARSPIAPPPLHEAPPPLLMVNPGTVAGGLAAIRAHDPAFDDQRLLSQVERCFYVVQEALTERRPELSRAVMDDSLWQRQRLEVEELVQRNRRIVLDDLRLDNSAIVAAASDQSFDTLTVRIEAEYVEVEVDASSGRIVAGDQRRQHVTESWVFQRSARAVTRSDGGTLARVCPQCGAPLDVDLAGVCSYCHVAVMSGELDWVLTRIERLPDASSLDPGTLALVAAAADVEAAQAAAAAAPAAGGSAAGGAHPFLADGVDLSRLRSADPSFSVIEFLTDARSAFYDVEEAMSTGDPERSRERLLPALWDQQRQQIERDASLGRRHVLPFLDLRDAKIVASAADPQGDSLTVRFEAQSGDAERDDATGELSGGAAPVHTWIERWTFTRPGPAAPAGDRWLVSAIERETAAAPAA